MLAPTNKAFTNALNAGSITPEQMQNATFLQTVLNATLLPGSLTADELARRETVTTLSGETLTVGTGSAGKGWGRDRSLEVVTLCAEKHGGSTLNNASHRRPA